MVCEPSLMTRMLCRSFLTLFIPTWGLETVMISLQINVYDLKAKNVLQILPQRQGFTIANQSLELTSGLHLILRFRRSFDNSFTLAGQTVGICNSSWHAGIPELGMVVAVLMWSSRAEKQDWWRHFFPSILLVGHCTALPVSTGSLRKSCCGTVGVAVPTMNAA